MRWTPEVADGDEASALVELVSTFQSKDTPAGEEAAHWLRDEALDNHGSTVTWLLLDDRELHGYYAMASTSVRLSQRHRRRLLPRATHDLTPAQPASLIAWIAKRRDAPSGTGTKLFQHAVTSAIDVSEVQGNIAIVVDAYDAVTAQMWIDRYGFRRSVRDGQRTQEDWDDRPRLWAPLLDP